MDMKENKFKIFIGLLVVVIFGCLFQAFKGKSKTNMLLVSSIKYEMPRPSSNLPSEFSLNDREIDYDYQNKLNSAEVQAKKETKDKDGKVKDVAKKTAKKDDAKKKKKTAKKKNNKKTTDNENTAETDQREASPLFAPAQQNPNGSNLQAAQNPPAEEVLPDEEERSAQQWRSLLSAQPTIENMDKLLRAYNQREVDDAEFYVIIEDLFKSQKSENQKVGFHGLRTVQSAKSFSLLSEYYENFNPDTKPQATQLMASYGSSARLDILAQAMRSPNPKTALFAVNVAQMSLSSARQNPRDVRAGGGSRNARKYAVLLPALLQLQQSGSPEVAGIAGQLYSQLQQIGVVAAGQQQVSASSISNWYY